MKETKDTLNLIDPTNRSHTICISDSNGLSRTTCVCVCVCVCVFALMCVRSITCTCCMCLCSCMRSCAHVRMVCAFI